MPHSLHRSRRSWSPRPAATFLAGLAAVLSACHQSGTVPFSPHPHPIIIIDIDTLRADRLGCYGNHRNTSPNLDSLGAESILFNWAFSQAPNTGPSQTTILSGLYPTTHGKIPDEAKVPDEALMLAEALAAEGFKTAGLHDGGYLSDFFNIGQGFDLYQDFRGRGFSAIIPEAIDWLRANADTHFLLFLHTYDTHTPYAPKEPYRSAFINGLEPPSPGFDPSVETMETARLSQYTDSPIVFPENDIEWAKAMYDAEILYVDEWVGRLLEEIRSLNLDERATIVVISDHGEEFQEHGTVLHEKLYSSVTHVPLMIRLPGGVGATRVERVVGTVDLMPTLLDMVSVPIPESVEGSSLLPVMLGLEDASRGGTTFSESPYFGIRRAVVHDTHHLLLTRRNSKVELYDFKRDTAEQQDLSGTHHDTVAELRTLLDHWIATTTPLVASGTGTEPLDNQTQEQLRALGYIQ
jgi:arylsulfatase A-like enzyme